MRVQVPQTGGISLNFCTWYPARMLMTNDLASSTVFSGTSSRIQNDLIEAIANVPKEDIKEELSVAQFAVVEVDETITSRTRLISQSFFGMSPVVRWRRLFGALIMLVMTGGRRQLLTICSVYLRSLTVHTFGSANIWWCVCYGITLKWNTGKNLRKSPRSNIYSLLRPQTKPRALTVCKDDPWV